MSKLKGHWRLTERAVVEVSAACPRHPVGARMATANLQVDTVGRDLLDIVLLGHWGDYGQKHHFMRRFDGQSPYEAYVESTQWIYENALAASELLAQRVRVHLAADESRTDAGQRDPFAITPPVGSCPLPQVRNPPKRIKSAATRVWLVTQRAGMSERSSAGDAVSWRTLGNAIHALQDSFAEGHAERTAPQGNRPGKIRHIKRYTGSEKEGHSEADLLWWNESKGTFSQSGRDAIDATKGLVLLIAKSALEIAASGRSDFLSGWKTFKEQWLAAADDLRRERDFAIDVIEQFQTSVTFGASSLTVSMDERGLAAALIAETRSQIGRVLDTFRRLDQHHSSDADDVALHYAEQLQRPSSEPARQSVRGNRELIELLVRLLERGYTGSAEQSGVAFLRSL